MNQFAIWLIFLNAYSLKIWLKALEIVLMLEKSIDISFQCLAYVCNVEIKLLFYIAILRQYRSLGW